MLRINGRAYWGDEASLAGWTPKIGDFEILDAQSKFRRYIAHKNIELEQLQEHYNEVVELARKYGVKPTEIFFTKEYYYPSIKHANIFFLSEAPSGLSKLFENDLKTIQRKLENGSLNKTEILLSIDIHRKRSTSLVVDIKDPLKNVYIHLFESLDKILFSSKEAIKAPAGMT